MRLLFDLDLRYWSYDWFDGLDLPNAYATTYVVFYVSTWLGKHEVDIVMFKSVVLYSTRFCILCGITTTFFSSVRYMR